MVVVVGVGFVCFTVSFPYFISFLLNFECDILSLYQPRHLHFSDFIVGA